MKENKPILRQFSDLTPNDFIEYPIWVHCHTEDYDETWYDETDEETFRPWIEETPVSPEYGMFLIKTDFKLKDGTVLPGFVTPCLDTDCTNENDLGLIQPQIFTEKGERIGFWTGMFPMESSSIDDFYKLMNKDSEKIFPIEFKANNNLSTGVSSGLINGFLTIEEDNNIRITK